ncbi:FAD/NAD(P)-binding oxidoreductase family protein [Actinidia rufa]|uniref:Ubiquinone biosynthesis monooxygenase COQ6, mitochondrial n=1 Tax=Actinidia rufa TaxID=165716 RepID=A0A7J0E501_9ERIC|nr:FAD/NAD(P)-binding oxidoreductase family protein [Actinidia rufa]
MGRVHGSGLQAELRNEHGSKNNVPQYDIAIVGGGMVGMALACSLASRPLTKQLTVAIIDSNPALGREEHFKKDDPPDSRVSTVTPATISFYKGMKDNTVNVTLSQNKNGACGTLVKRLADFTTGKDTQDIMREMQIKKLLGCVVENKVLHRSLLSCIQNKDFQKTIYPSRLTSMTLSPSLSSVGVGVDGTSSGTTTSTCGGLAKLELSDGSSLYTKLVVGADGSKSHVRELAGFKTTGWKYSQNAIICTVEHAVDNQCAWQRFLPAGPIALLPIGDKFSNIVWTMSPKESSDCKSMSEDDFVDAVNNALDYGYGPHPQSKLFGGGNIFSWFGADITSSASECFEVPPKAVKLASERMVFPLSLMHANKYASRRVVLIGDAAHTVHPLAGQGVNLGFGDASALSRVIAEGVAVGSDIGQVTLLKRYEADRKMANITMMAILDGFQKAYSVDFGPLNVLRAAAFHGAQYISPLKRNIISFASGEQSMPLFS